MKTIEKVSVISEQDKVLLGEATEIIRTSMPTARVLLYGSVAKGTQSSDSDYDLLVLTEGPVSKDEKTAVEHRLLELELEREVVLSTMYYSMSEWSGSLLRVSPFHSEIERDAVIL
jgi:predicted nucleotidyltransferase